MSTDEAIDAPVVAIRHLLLHCGNLVPGERVALIVDATTRNLAPGFAEATAASGAAFSCLEVPVADRHGQAPPSDVEAKAGQGDLILGLTKMSLAHTRARQNWCAQGSRYLSLPGYSADLLADPCITADYRGQHTLTRTIADAFSAGSTVRITTEAGTGMRLRINGRTGNCCPGFVDNQYPMGSPPDIEANVSPLETESEGVAIIDGSVSCDEVGLLDTTIALRIAGGRIVGIHSDRSDLTSSVSRLFSRVGDDNAYILAECGIGLNPLARLTGNMLTDEGTLGCVHFGFGSNITVGGANDVPFHVDFVFRGASLWIDDQQILSVGHPSLSDNVL